MIIAYDRKLVHTLNNHLAIILGYADLLLDDIPGDDPNCAGVREIRKAVLAAAALFGGEDSVSV